MTTARPLIGFGLDAQHAHRYPGSLEGLVESFRPRLTHISIVSVNSVEAAKRFRERVARGLPIVHHLSGVAPADPDGPHLERLCALGPITRELGAVWTGEDIGLWTIGPYAIPYFAPPIFDREFAREIGARIRDMRALSPAPFLAEVPSCTVATGRMDLGSFFVELTEAGGCDIVLDVSHVYSYALLTGRDPVAVQSSLPLHCVREAHVAGGRIDPEHPARYVDSHSDDIRPEVLALLNHAARHCARLEAVTYEIGVGLSAADIDHGVRDIERVLAGAGWKPAHLTASA